MAFISQVGEMGCDVHADQLCCICCDRSAVRVLNDANTGCGANALENAAWFRRKGVEEQAGTRRRKTGLEKGLRERKRGRQTATSFGVRACCPVKLALEKAFAHSRPAYEKNAL